MRICTDTRVSEFAHVGLGNDYGSARAKTPDHRCIGGRRLAFLGEHFGADARHFAGHVEQILDADDRPVERSERNPGLRTRIGGVGRGFRLIPIDREAGSRTLAFRIIDATERGLEPFAGRRWLHERFLDRIAVSLNVVLFLSRVQPVEVEDIMSAKTGDKGKHSPPGAGNIYAKANEVIVKITGDDTAQTFEVVEENCKPGFQSRAHYHIKAYETFYVFDGSADFQVGDELFHAQKGSCVHIPPGVPHQVTSKDGVRMLMIYSPAGTEGMFAAMHALSQEQLMNAELTKKLALKHGTVMIEQSKDGRGKGTILG
jgi:mannose-6-phosphate isomerase-like protein (cupin superfamily)